MQSGDRRCGDGPQQQFVGRGGRGLCFAGDEVCECFGVAALAGGQPAQLVFAHGDALVAHEHRGGLGVDAVGDQASDHVVAACGAGLGDPVPGVGDGRRDGADRKRAADLVVDGVGQRCGGKQRVGEAARRRDRVAAGERVPAGGGLRRLRAEDVIERDRVVALVDAVALAAHVEHAGRGALDVGAKDRLDESEGLAASGRAGDEDVLAEGVPVDGVGPGSGERPRPADGPDDHAALWRVRASRERVP